MKKVYVLILIGIGIIAGCSTGQDKSVKEHILNDLNTKYNNAKKFFGKAMVSHFPLKLDSSNITFTENYSPDLGNLELIVINRTEKSQLMSIISEFKDKAIGYYSAGDSCLLVVNRFATCDNYYKAKPYEEELHLINRDCYSNKLPVPNFWHNEFTTETTSCSLPEDFTIYVIEADAGEYFDKKYLTKGDFMPSEWKNGYSKGIALSEKKQVIIFWLIIW